MVSIYCTTLKILGENWNLITSSAVLMYIVFIEEAMDDSGEKGYKLCLEKTDVPN